MYTKGTALAGKVAIITGGASGIGEAVGKIFAANQCKVVLVDINNERLQNVAAEITTAGGTCRAVYADVTEEDQGIKFFKDTVDEWGRVDVLVNSAGRDSLAPPVTEVTLDEWNKTIGPNMTAVFLTCREAFKVMEKQESG
jgi:NAD(P)-dependent dehydrogenase (short-subunit alcohol dehydrogenase family)